MYNSVNRGFIVCRQGFHSGDRFSNLDEAVLHAAALSRSRPQEVFEVLSCTHNVSSNMLVDIITEEE